MFQHTKTNKQKAKKIKAKNKTVKHVRYQFVPRCVIIRPQLLSRLGRFVVTSSGRKKET